MRLRVFKNGVEWQSLDLKTDEDNVVGRGEKCDLQLPADPGISRQHFRVFWDGSQWMVEVMSRFASLKLNGEEADQFPLGHETEFHLNTFLFRFEEPHLEQKNNPEKESEENEPANLAVIDTSENTNPGHSEDIPYLRIEATGQGQKETLRLEGENWLLGRDESCEIQLEESLASRRHLEIYSKGFQYFVKDLDSSNGTFVNGSPIQANEERSLASGDKIQIGDTTITFELRDPNFDQKLAVIPENLLIAPSIEPPQVYQGANDYNHSGSYSFGEAKQENKWEQLKKNKVFWVAAGLVIFALLSLLSESPEKPSNIPSNAGNVAYEKLTEQQKSLVNDTYALAKNLYMQGKYELAAAQLKKIHDLIPFYKDSKEIESHVRQAFEIKKQQRMLRVRKEEETALKRKVARLIDACESRKANFRTADDAHNCLQPAMELDPANPRIEAILEELNQREVNRRQRRIAQANHKARRQEATNLYQKALRQHKSGNLLTARSTYQSLISSSLPNPGGIKGKAKSNIGRINKEIESQISKFMREGDSLLKNLNYKAAVLAYKKALKFDPNNAKVRDQINDTVRKLRKDLKAIYEDSVIEESLGNVETAKEKWRRIKELDLEDGEYYNKAKSKLKLYGG